MSINASVLHQIGQIIIIRITRQQYRVSLTSVADIVLKALWWRIEIENRRVRTDGIEFCEATANVRVSFIYRIYTGL